MTFVYVNLSCSNVVRVEMVQIFKTRYYYPFYLNCERFRRTLSTLHEYPVVGLWHSNACQRKRRIERVRKYREFSVNYTNRFTTRNILLGMIFLQDQTLRKVKLAL